MRMQPETFACCSSDSDCESVGPGRNSREKVHVILDTVTVNPYVTANESWPTVLVATLSLHLLHV